jgi:hypothetical protein
LSGLKNLLFSLRTDGDPQIKRVDLKQALPGIALPITPS